MYKSIKKLLVIALLPLLVTGCDSLFDEGDVEREYDGATVVGLFPLTQDADEGDGDVTIEVQLIGPQRSSDVNVTFSTTGTAVAGTNYTVVGGTTVTIPANSSTADITLNIPADNGLNAGDEATILVNITGGDVEASVNLATSTVFIAGN